MDQQRYVEERKEEKLKDIHNRLGKKSIILDKVNYRLMQEWEVPEWIKIKPEDPNKIT